MMKICILLVISLILPFTLYSFISLLLIMLTMLAFFFNHFQDIFMLHKLLFLDSLSYSLISLTKSYPSLNRKDGKSQGLSASAGDDGGECSSVGSSPLKKYKKKMKKN